VASEVGPFLVPHTFSPVIVHAGMPEKNPAHINPLFAIRTLVATFNSP